MTERVPGARDDLDCVRLSHPVRQTRREHSDLAWQPGDERIGGSERAFQTRSGVASVREAQQRPRQGGNGHEVDAIVRDVP